MFHPFSLASSSTFRRQLAARASRPRLYLAVVLGLLFGLFLYSYWLVDLLPVGSRFLLVLAIAACVFGAAGYYLLLGWSVPRLMCLPRLGHAALAAASLGCGAILLLGGTTAWLQPARSIPFLLPSHRLAVKATGGTRNPSLALLWFNTSLGEVSFNTLQYTGWKRVGDLLVLQNPNQNSLEWKGTTGEAVELVWRGSSEGSLQVSWDGQLENVKPAAGKMTFTHTFAVPWYASRAAVCILGIFIFASLAVPMILLVWTRREALLLQLREAFTTSNQRWGRLDLMILIGAGILALLLRLPNLGVLYPPVDEYFHLIAARQIAEGAALNSVYGRSLWLVTLPISLSFRLFGFNVWAARLPGVLFNVLAIPPLYLLARKINPPIAALSVVLYATSPWIVTFARIAREYAYYPFYFYWIILGMVVLIEQIPRDFVVLRDWRRLLTPKTILLAMALVLPPLFTFFGDPLSTFKTILLAYLVLGAFMLARLDFRDRSNWPFLGALGIGVMLIGFAAYQNQSAKISLVPSFNPVPVSYFIPDPRQQWYYGQLVPVVLVALIGALLCGYLLRRVNFIPLFAIALYGIGLFFFAFLSKIFFHTRHLLTTELWFIIIVAVGLYILWKVIAALNYWRRPYANVLLAAAMMLALVNWQQISDPVGSTNPDNLISEDYLHNMSQVQEYMLEHVQPQDVLISTVYGLYSSWQEQPRFQAQYRITTETPRDEVLSLIAEYTSGWIVIDQIRLEASTLGLDAFAGNPDVEYIGLFGDENVWRWQRTASCPASSAVAGKGAWIYRW